MGRVPSYRVEGRGGNLKGEGATPTEIAPQSGARSSLHHVRHIWSLGYRTLTAHGPAAGRHRHSQPQPAASLPFTTSSLERPSERWRHGRAETTLSGLGKSVWEPAQSWDQARATHFHRLRNGPALLRPHMTPKIVLQKVTCWNGYFFEQSDYKQCADDFLIPARIFKPNEVSVFI